MPKLEVPKFHPLCMYKNYIEIAPFIVSFVTQSIGVVWYYQQEYYTKLNSVDPSFNFVFNLSLLGTTALVSLFLANIAFYLKLFKFNFLMVLMAFLAFCQSLFGIVLASKLKKVTDKNTKTYMSYYFYVNIGGGFLLCLFSIFALFKCYNN